LRKRDFCLGSGSYVLAIGFIDAVSSTPHKCSSTLLSPHQSGRPLFDCKREISMTCKIIAHTSSRHAAKYHVQAAGSVYEAHVKDLPGEGCSVHIEGLEEGSELFQSIEGCRS